MQVGRLTGCGLLLWSLVSLLVSQRVLANSLFVVSDHNGGVTEVFDINGSQLDLTLSSTELSVYGLTFALSPSDEVLFCSFDQANKLEAAHARSMKKIDTFSAPGEAAGLAFDPPTHRLFAARREQKLLDIYEWNSTDQELICGESFFLSQVAANGVFDISLDTENQLLYISDNSDEIHRLDVSGDDPNYVDSIYLDDGYDTYKAVGIDFYDGGPGLRYLYAGAWVHGSGHPYLIRVDLDRYATDPCDPCAVIAKDIGTLAIGLAVDPDTGLVYITTHRTVGQSTGSIEVYDTSSWINDPNQVVTYSAQISGGSIDGPAGLIVGPTYKPSLMPFGKSDSLDPNDCADLDETFSYSICYGGDPNAAQTNVTLIDYLPFGVDFVSADPCNVGDYYDEESHAFFWDIGTVPAAEPNACVTLTVQVNDGADPLGTLVNKAVLESDDSYSRTFHSTPVCERGGSIIFVNADAEYDAGCMGDICWRFGMNTGLSWEDAYRDLQDALERAAKMTPPVEIWVAEGIYKVTNSDLTDSFTIGKDISVYGGFAGNEVIRTARSSDPSLCVLDGDFCDEPVEKIVTFEPYAGEALLDGFTITGGEVGIYCENTFDANDVTRPTIRNCVVKLNAESGVFCANYGDVLLDECTMEDNTEYGVEVTDDSYAELYDCIVKDNTLGGVDCDSASVDIIDSTIEDNGGSGVSGNGAYVFAQNNGIKANIGDGVYGVSSTLEMEGSLIESNTGDGLELSGTSDAIIKRTRIRQNTNHGVNIGDGVLDTDILNSWIHDNDWDGLYFNGASRDPIVRNNTIAYNGQYGVYRLAGRRPEVSNCIIWGNNDVGNDIQVYDCFPTYSCIADPCSPTGTGNINSDPCFATDTTLGNFHLDPNSLCRDAGDPNAVIAWDETDIDNEDRIEGFVVDMGGDEVHECDNGSEYKIAHPWDWNTDGIINLPEFNGMAAAWLTTTGGQDWNANCDLSVDGEIDIDDLTAFVEDWLWQACWHDSAQESGQVLMMMGMGMMGMESAWLPYPAPEPPATEITLPQPSIDAQLATIAECIAWAQEALDENPSDEQWQDIVENLWELFYTLAEQQ